MNIRALGDLAKKGIGLALLSAGAFTIHDSWQAIQPVDLSASLAVLVAVVECLVGVALLVRSGSERTWLCALALVAGLWASSIVQIALGRCSSGRFGSMAVNPWGALVFDVVALFVLLRGNSSELWMARVAESPRRLLFAGFVALFVAASGISSRPPVSVTGLATFNGEPLEEGNLIFSGDSIGLVVMTDRDGTFRLPPIRPGLYRVTIGGKAALPNPMPDPARSRTKDGTTARSTPRLSLKQRVSRFAKQGTVEPIRPRGDAGILTWDAPPCCGEPIPFHFVPGDTRRAIGW
jgi:hypothetical protein